MYKVRFLLLLFLVFICTVFVVATPVFAIVTNLINFNSTNDLTDYFNSDGSAQFTNGSTGGIGNTGAISVPLGTTDIWTTKQGYSVTGSGDIYTFSAFFKIQANGGYGGLGFSNADTNSGDSQGHPVKGIGMSFHGGGGSFVNNRTYTDVSWPPDLVLGNWYKMIFKVTAKGSNTYDLNFQIWNSDSNGTLGTMKTEKNLNNVVNSDLGSASIIHGFFAAAGSRMEKIDDFLIELDGGAVFIEEGLPVVSTTVVSSITGTTASSGGNVTADQGASVTARGVCWNTSTSPTTSHQCTTNGTGTGSFTSTLSGLSGSTTYYVRAYATNSEGTSYGNETSFVTDVVTSTPTPTPVPGNTVTHSADQVVTTSVSSSGPTSCSDTIPSVSPDLFQIDSTETTATLYFTPVSGVNSYYLSYATNNTAEEHGAPVLLGSEGVQQYTVSLLSPNTVYYFKVRGQNGCMPGTWSTIQSQATKGRNLEYTDSARIEEEITLENEEAFGNSTLSTQQSDVCSYLVQPGDSLWKIALMKLGNAERFKEIQELNGMSSPVVSINDELQLPCDSTLASVTESNDPQAPDGTLLAILVKDSREQPIEGVTVTLHSIVQVGKTDKDGIVRFENVEPGDHRVILSYNAYTGEESLIVDGTQKEQSLTLQVQMNTGFSSQFVLFAIALLSAIILMLLFFILVLWKRRKKENQK